MKHSIRLLLFILILTISLSAFGCSQDTEQQPIRTAEDEIIQIVENTPAPTLAESTPFVPETTPEEDVIAPIVTETPMQLPTPPTPTPSPEPTPTPAPTEIPFSYYAPVVNMSFEELVGSLDDFDESNPRSNQTFLMPAGYPMPDTYRIIVDLYWQLVLVYAKDPATGEYTVPVRYMPCSSGSTRVGSETQTGTFKMKPTRVRFGNFKSGETAQYWSLIRSRTYFHSIIYNKYRDLSSVDKKAYEALANGQKASHACIRLTVPDARWIFYNICYDTVCEIRKGSKDDSEMAAIRAQMHLAPWKDNADLSVANTPYTDNWRIDDVALEMPYVHATQPPVPTS